MIKKYSFENMVGQLQDKNGEWIHHKDFNAFVQEIIPYLDHTKDCKKSMYLISKCSCGFDELAKRLGK